MPFCATCGSQVEGRFCAKCGSPVQTGAAPGAAPAAAPPPVSNVPPAGGYQQQPASQAMADNVASTLCYVLGFITGILFLVLDPYNKNRVVRFHAFQSIFLSVAAFVLNLAVGIVLGALPFGLWGLIALLNMLVGLAFLGLWLYMLVMTYQGKTIVLPVVGPLAQKQA